MTFEDFWKNETGPSHFAGQPAPKDLARAAWNRATLAEREACASLAELCDDQESAARFIRARSNAQLQGPGGSLPGPAASES